MTWAKDFGLLEWIIIGLFILFYLLYLLRLNRVGRILKTNPLPITLKTLLRFAYFSLLVTALLGPSFGESLKEVKSIGKDIFITVDLSESMNADDVQPTRLERVKYELKNIVDAFSSDRVGIIIFSSEAFVQCPLTFDRGALYLFIDAISTNLVPNSGTDFNPPLEMALKKLNEGNSVSTQQKSKVIVMISDGENFGEDINNVSQEIEDSGIKLFTLGVGTNKGARLKSGRGFKKDRSGREVVTKLEIRRFEEISHSNRR